MSTENELSVEFCLTDEQKEELKVLTNALIEKCREFEAPVMIAICTENSINKDSKWLSAEANYFNGERTPTAMAIARTIVDKNITHPVQLLVLMSN